MQTNLNALADGYSIDTAHITSGPAVQTTDASFGCTHGTVAGMCAGENFFPSSLMGSKTFLLQEWQKTSAGLQTYGSDRQQGFLYAVALKAFLVAAVAHCC